MDFSLNFLIFSPSPILPLLRWLIYVSPYPHLHVQLLPLVPDLFCNYFENLSTMTEEQPDSKRADDTAPGAQSTDDQSEILAEVRRLLNDTGTRRPQLTGQYAAKFGSTNSDFSTKLKTCDAESYILSKSMVNTDLENVIRLASILNTINQCICVVFNRFFCASVFLHWTDFELGAGHFL